MSLYPYDPEGLLPSNKVTGTVSINTFPNKFNVMVPKEAPFFRTNFKLKRNNVTLIEGLDYYLVYYYKSAADAVQRPVFGGILPIGDWDSAEYEFQTLGGGHQVPQTEVGRYLNREDIKDPRSVDWSDLQRYPVHVDPINPPNDFEEAVLQDPVVAALVKIKEALSLAAPERDELFERLFNEIAITEEYYNTNLLEIHTHGEHDHKYTAVSVGALRKEATAVDALKAYGYTLAQFVDTAKEHGISMVQINELIDNTMGLMWGSITGTASGAISISTYGGSVGKRPKIDLTGSNISLEAGDKDVQVVGSEGGWLGSGLNAIVLPKVTDAGVRPILNGYYILVPTDVPRYLTAANVANLKATVASTPTVSLFGNGTPSSPIYGRVNPVNAAPGRDGLSTLSNVWGANLPAVVTQKLMTDTINSISGFALKTVRINNLSFETRDNIEVTAGMLGLGNVQNTSANEKPVHTHLGTALQAKALAEHEHTIADLEGSLLATDKKAGLGRIGTNGFALEAPVSEFLEGVEDGLKLADNAVPAWASSGLYYGDGSYLPAPVDGNYRGFGAGRGVLKTGIILENNLLILLRNGTDGTSESEGVYYWTSQITPTSLRNTRSTTVRYHPAFLNNYSNNPKAWRVAESGEGVLILQTRDDAGLAEWWVVLTQNTGDMTKHIYGCRFAPYHSATSTKPLIVDGSVYLIDAQLSSHEHFVSIWKTTIEDIKNAALNQTVVVFEAMRLHGVNHYNEPFDSVGRVWLVPGGRLFIRDDGNKWSTLNVRHGPTCNYILGVDGLKVRVNMHVSCWLANAVTSVWGSRWQTSFVIDLASGKVVPDHNYFPIVVGIDDLEFRNGRLNYGLYPGFEANNVANSITIGKHTVFVRHQNIQSDPIYLVYRSDDDIDTFAAARFDRVHPAAVNLGSGGVSGRYGSVYTSNMRGPLKISEDRYLLRSGATNYIIEVKVDKNGSYGLPNTYAGFGPTSERSVSNMARYVEYLGMVRDCGGGVEVWDGTVYTAPGEKIYRRDGLNKMMLSTTVWNRLLNVVNEHPGIDPDKSFLGSDVINRAMSATFFGTGVDRKGVLWGVWNVKTTEDAAGPRYSRSAIVFFDYDVVATDRGVSVTNPRNFKHLDWVGGAGGWRTIAADGTHQTMRIDGGNGKITYVIGSLAQISSVSGGSSITGLLSYDWNTDTIIHCAYRSYHPSFGEGSVDYNPYNDTFVLVGYIGNGLYLGGATYRASDPTVNIGLSVLHGAKTPEDWNVYFTQEYPFYAEGKIYTLPIVDFDLRVLFPANYQNRTFHIHVRSDGTKAWYTIDVNKLPDTASRLNVGYVTTDNERIIDLTVNSTRRFGNVGALVRHEANRYAHDTSPEALVQNSQYSELKNMGMVDGFTLPTFKDIFNSWYRFSHMTNSPNIYPANAGELNRWVYDDTNDSIRCTVNSATYVGFISNDMVGDYVFNTVLTSNDGDNDSITVIPAAFRQGDIDNREHTISVMVDHTLNEEHHKPGSHIRVWDNYGQHDQRSIAVLDARRFSVSWSGRYAHVYVRRTGNMLFVAVKAQPLPSENLNPRNIQPLVDNLKRVTVQQMLVSGSGYVHATIDLAVEAPRFARASRYGYGCWSQLNSMYWNIQRPGADLSNFYASEETLRLSMRRDPITYRIIHGKIAPLTTTAEDLPGGVIANHSRFDNYGDRFWPNAQYSGYNTWPPLRSLAPGNPYRRDGSAGRDRWFLAKVRFSVAKDGILKITSNVDDTAKFWLQSNVGVSGTSPKYTTTGTEVTVAARQGDYSLLFLVAERVGQQSPSMFVFSAEVDGVVICSSNDDLTKAITLPNGLNEANPSLPQAGNYVVPSAIRIPYDRPEGTAISVSVNRHYGDKRAQIDTNADFTPISLEMTEHGMNGVVIETTAQNGRFVDNIYIHQPYSNVVSSDITYQIRVTKI